MAEDFPEDKYDFLPASGTSSFAERLIHASALSNAPFGGSVGAGSAFRARLIKPFERGRPSLRQTRALWKFKGGKERRADVARLLCGAQQLPGWA